MRRRLLCALPPMLLVSGGALGQATVDGHVAPSTLPPLFNQTTAVCGTGDRPISPAAGTLPTRPHNFLIQNVQQAPGSGATNAAHVFTNWTGGVSSTSGLDFGPGASHERAASATPHCPAPGGPVTNQIGW
jgi:hypothetical protein